MTKPLCNRIDLPCQATDLVEQGVRLEQQTTVHKWDPVTIGVQEFYIPQCRSERPAYTIRAVASSATTELLHTYCCMGLERAHEHQQVVLSRCRSHSVARCIMLAAAELFGHKVRRELVCRAIPEEAGKKEQVENEWREWLELLAERETRRLPSFDAEDVDTEIELSVPVELRDACREILAALR